MKDITSEIQKRQDYQSPEIRVIEIDRSISLLMQSANPGGDPDETKIPLINTLNNPFKG